MNDDFASFSQLHIFPSGILNPFGSNNKSMGEQYPETVKITRTKDGDEIVEVLGASLKEGNLITPVETDTKSCDNFTRWLSDKKNKFYSYDDDLYSELLNEYPNYIFEQLTSRYNLENVIDYNDEDLNSLISAAVYYIGFDFLTSKVVKHHFFEDVFEMFRSENALREGTYSLKILEKYFVNSKYEQLIFILNDFRELLNELIDLRNGDADDSDSGFAEA